MAICELIKLSLHLIVRVTVCGRNSTLDSFGEALVAESDLPVKANQAQQPRVHYERPPVANGDRHRRRELPILHVLGPERRICICKRDDIVCALGSFKESTVRPIGSAEADLLGW